MQSKDPDDCFGWAVGTTQHFSARRRSASLKTLTEVSFKLNQQPAFRGGLFHIPAGDGHFENDLHLNYILTLTISAPMLILGFVSTRQSLDGIKSICDTLNEGAAVARAHGLQVGYHNHWFEYEPVENRIPIDVMLEHLDADVFFEVDVYWVQTAGQDPVEVIRRLGSRAPLLHVKDGPCQLEAPMTALGEGVVDIPGVVAAGAGSTEWLVVELDRCATDVMEAVRKSYHYLIGKGLVRGNKT